jgi:DNA-binding MarR family transcriptional regulator
VKGSEQVAFTALIAAVTRLHQRLQAIDGVLHARAGLPAAQRGVMESLGRRGDKTVSQLAGQRGVSRQHVQVIVNQLMDKGLVIAVDNPAHRRSPLIRLTDEGRVVFREMRQREKEFLATLELPLDALRLEQARQCLDAVDDELARLG